MRASDLPRWRWACRFRSRAAGQSRRRADDQPLHALHVFNGDALGGGGAVQLQQATLNLTNVTLNGNVADQGDGGVIYSAGGDLPNLDGFFNSHGYHIIGELGSVPGNPTITATTGDQFNVAFAALQIGFFQNNGGAVPTRALNPGSIAIDAGHTSGLTTDQRGFIRPCDDPLIANAAGGDGADVGAFEVQNGVCGSNAEPVANASVSIGTLWSPNNKLVDVGLTIDDGDSVSTTVTVSSDEDDGATSDASGMLLLRGERSGSGAGLFVIAD